METPAELAKRLADERKAANQQLVIDAQKAASERSEAARREYEKSQQKGR